MKKSGAKKNKSGFLEGLFFWFPFLSGIACTCERALSVCRVLPKTGEVKLTSHRLKYGVIAHPNFPFLRGLEFFWFGIRLYFGLALAKFRATDKTNVLNSLGGTKTTIKNVLIATAFGLLALLGALLVGWGLLGFLPAYLGSLMFPSSPSVALKTLCVAIFRCVLLVGTILALCHAASPVRGMWRFLSAGNLASSGKKFFALGWFNVALGGGLLHIFVLSLIPLPLPLFWTVLIKALTLALCMALMFEALLFAQKTGGAVARAGVLLGLVFYAPPSQTTHQVAKGAFVECVLMKTPEREELSDIPAGETNLALVLSDVHDILKAGGVEDMAEAEWVIAETLGVLRLDLRFKKSVPNEVLPRMMAVAERRAKGEPLDKIFERAEFFSKIFKVNKNVLTPRLETELLVEQVFFYINTATPHPKKVLDLCTGSGIIAITLALHHPELSITAVDVSEDALDVARENATNLGASVKFKQSDMFSSVAGKKFDIIVSNPPYIKTDDIALLEREVKNHDPIIALDGGRDGLYFYRQIAALAPQHLSAEGRLFLEIGTGQGAKVKKLLTENFKDIKILKDYNGHQRMVIATKKD